MKPTSRPTSTNRTAPGAPVRAAAAHVIQAVINHGRSLDDALAFATSRNRFDSRDHALLSAMVYGVLRHYRRLGWQLEQMMDRPLRDAPLVEALLRVGLYQMHDMRIPDHAVVSATTAAATLLQAEWAGSLVNALLRRSQREPERLEPPDDMAIRHSWPNWMVETIRRDWGEQAETVLAEGSEQAPMTLRVNRRRMTAADYIARLSQGGRTARALAGAPDAVVLETAGEVDALPGFSRGSVSVQDASAQLAVQLLDVQPGQRVLDACSAPGGKAAHILESCPKADLTALDSDRSRLQSVAETLRRVGAQASLIAADAADTKRWWDEKPFDRILIDAPCSGTGVVRRHPDIKWLRRVSDVRTLSKTQEQLLNALWPLLAPGGRLVFATCSILRSEGGEVVDRFLQRHPEAHALPCDLPVGTADGAGWRIPPGGDWDGFYYAILSRSD